MNNELICPFCDSEIEQLNDQQRSLFHCSNIVCCKGGHYIGNISMWRDLIRTRKALEWARHFLKEIRLRYLIEKDNPSRQNKWADTALYMYNCSESFFDDYDKTNETKGDNNE